MIDEQSHQVDGSDDINGHIFNDPAFLRNKCLARLAVTRLLHVRSALLSCPPC